MGDQKNYYLELLRASEGTLSRWSRLHLQSLAPTNPHWARVVGHGPISILTTSVAEWEGLCPSSGDINRLMMMMMIFVLFMKIKVTIKIRPVPAVTRYGSLVFPDWESGFHFEREVARRRMQPSSIRLMDNEQFRFGQALKTESSWGGVLLDGLKRAYITRIKGFDPTKLCVVTLLMEGEADQVASSYAGLRQIAAQYGGIPAGAENGERGYTLTFVIAYLRDVAMEYDVVAESFETSVPWDRTLALCANVKTRVREECQRRDITHYLISCRLTQTYDAGCCIYFYFAHNTSQCCDPVATYEEIEEAARDEIIASGGSISHHHGVGKLRKKWYTDTVSEPGRLLLLAAKKALDPDNIFALGNMAFEEGNATENLSIKSKL
ncbi:hypothetical protein evm_009960 [Chilo suppressalis]|nr:hypothetical protein evm_009960 [Chilo suppressalis]